MVEVRYRPNRRCWRRVRIPIVVIGFLCLLYCGYREHARVDDTTHMTLPVVASSNELLETRYEKELSDLTDFQATAYCDIGITRSGAETRHGYVAADPKVIPLGSMIYIESPLMGGVYQVMDTGSKVKGRIVDIFLPGYERCMIFGRRMVKVKVLRYGFAKDEEK